MDIFLPRSLLEARGIEFHILHQQAGEAIITSPGTYHQGYNMTDNLAEAANFAPEHWLPLDYVFCSSDCAKYYEAKEKREPNYKFKPMNLSALRKYKSELQINNLESVSYSRVFQVQEDLGS